MKVAGEYTFDAPQAIVWDALQDPEVLASIMPGCEKLELVGEDEYEGVLKIKIGPVQGTFKGAVKLEDIQAPDSYNITVSGRGAPGFMKGSGGLKLSAQEGQTLMTYEGDAQVGGRIASVGQRLVDSSAKAIIRQSLEALNTTLQARATVSTPAVEPSPSETPTQAATVEEITEEPAPVVPSVSPPSPPPQPQAPSQVEFATNVAKDVASDLIPQKYRPVLFGLGVIIVLVILYLIFR